MRKTQYEIDLRTMVASQLGDGFSVERSEVKRHARALFDIKFGDNVLGTGMTVQEMAAAVNVLHNFAQVQVASSEESSDTSEEEQMQDEPVAEETTEEVVAEEQMPEEEVTE
jgi:hypothetical protein